MSNNAPDYTDNLAFPPQGDWSDTQPKNNTDRTASTIELVNQVEKLTKQLDIALSSMRDSRELLYQLSQILAADAIGKQLQEIKDLEKC